jgi:protein SCO1
MSVFTLRSAMTPHRSWVIAIGLSLAFALAWQVVDHLPTAGDEAGFFSHVIEQTDAMPDIHLHDDFEVLHTLDEFHGKVVVLVIGSAQCDNDCTVALRRVATMRRDLGSAASHLQLIFASLATASPIAFQPYVRHFDDSIIALHASDALAIDLMRKRFSALRQRPSANATTSEAEAFGRQAAIYVFDADGRLRLELPDSETTDAMGSDVRRLIDGR